MYMYISLYFNSLGSSGSTLNGRLKNRAPQMDQRRAAELFDELDEQCHGARRMQRVGRPLEVAKLRERWYSYRPSNSYNCMGL